jgi:receptor protein-tyrosine kinase
VTNASEHLELERLFAGLRRRWWIIALITVLVGGASFAFSVRQRKQYTTTASVLLFSNPQIDPQSGLPVSSASLVTTLGQQATAIQVLSHQPAVARATAAIVGHGMTGPAVASAISVSEQGQSDIADVTANSPSPTLASAIANTFVTQYIASQRTQQRATLRLVLGEVEQRIAAMSRQRRAGLQGQALSDDAESLREEIGLTNGNVQLLAPARTPSAPSSPKVARNTALGLLLGFLLGVGVAVLLERLDRRMKTVEELEATYQLPLLAAIPQSKSYALPPQVDADSRRGDAEVFKLLRAYLRYFNVDRELRLLLVASAAPGDGKTTIAYNLAEAAQEAGTKTLLLEADLRRPDLSRHYGLSAGRGLSEVLIGSVDADDAIQQVPMATGVNGATSHASLDVLVAGHPPPNPAELIESRAMADLLSWAAEHYQMVVIDTPPIALVSDAMPLLRQVDGVILVSQLGRHTRDEAAFLRERLVGVKAPLLGVVANGVKTKSKGDYSSDDGYYGDASILATNEVSESVQASA